MLSFEQFIPKIIKSLRATYGEEFFNVLTMQLNEVIGADYTFIAKLDKEKNTSETISLVVDNVIADNFEYSLVGTPCAKVSNNIMCIYPKNISSFFPSDQLLIDMGIEGYVGTPLHDSQGEVMGIVVALYKEEIKDSEFIVTLFDFFSGRISAEIERTENEQKLFELNATLELRVAKRTAELSQALDHLKQYQSVLVEQEKLASLGNLLAGVAHEINTPISAVKSSGSNIADALKYMLANLPYVMSIMNEQCQTLFIQLLTHLDQPHEVLNSREERRITRQLSSQLEEEKISDAHHKAYILVQLHAWTAIDDYWMLLRHPQCELILEMGSSIATITSSTANINTAVERVDKIIFSLKSFTRLGLSEKVAGVNLRDGLETILTIYNSQIKEHTELIRHYDDIAPLDCYPDELNQVWTNLIHNAIQAMPKSGKLTIYLRREHNNAVVTISDTGGGIASDILDKIFTPFFTTKAIGEGSGLGLDIVKKIVDKHNGRIDVKSTVGVGTTFTIYLPYSMEAL